MIEADYWKGKRVVVTGHTGFKGVWLSTWLSRLHAKVSGISLDPTIERRELYIKSGISNNIACFNCDVVQQNRFSALIDEIQPEVIFHLAAQSLVSVGFADPVRTNDVNYNGTLSLLEYLRSCKRKVVVVFVTTDKVYAPTLTGKKCDESFPLGGHDPYSASKAASELLIESYRRSYFDFTDVKVATARAGNVIGGGDWASGRLVPDLMRGWTRGQEVCIRNKHHVRPWQHVLDPLCGYLMLAKYLSQSSVSFNQFNFGPTESASVGTVVDKITKMVPDLVVSFNQEAKSYENPYLALDSSRSFSELGWGCKWDLDTSFQKTVDWYQRYNDIGILQLCNEQIDEYMKGLH